tara:strand:+ start:1055 stop:1852 length:798 start_codon:yes stop_codon:yes gene_type:complete
MKKFILFFILIICSCSSKEEATSQEINDPSIGPSLIWSDEFNVDGAPSSLNWYLETIPPNNGSWWNNEDQYYTDRRENSIVENGVLKIIAKKEEYQQKSYTSARMTTQNLFDFKYGEVHVKAKLPLGQGTWPAIWMMGKNFSNIGWPLCGEIDIMEHGDGNPGQVSSAVHLANSDGNHYFLRGEQLIENESSEFHIYKLIWSASKIEFYVDDKKHHAFNVDSSMPFDKPFFFILNVAMGGDFTNGNIDPNFTSASMEIDYVRVYQ